VLNRVRFQRNDAQQLGTRERTHHQLF